MEKIVIISHKLIDKYKNLSVVVKASLWFALCNILQRGISILTVPIFTRILSTSEMGVFNVYNSWYSIISTIFTMNLSWSAYMVGIAKYENDEKRFTSSMQGVTLLLSAIGLIIYCLTNKLWNEILGLSSSLVILMFIETAFAPALQFWSAKERYAYRYKALAIITLGVAVLTPILGIMFIFLSKYNAEARIFSTVLINFIIGVVLTIKFVKEGKTLFDKKYWYFAFSFALPLIPHYLSQTLLNQSDRIMIDKFYGKDYAAIYGIAYSVASIFTIINNSINHSMTPWLYKCLKNGETKNISSVVNKCCIIVLLLNSIYIIFAPEIVSFFAPPSYHEAIWVIPPLAISVFMMFIYNICTSVEFYFEKSKYTMYSSLIAAVINIILNLIFIPRFGFLAAGYTSLFCYIIYSLGHYIIMKSLLKNKIDVNDIMNCKLLTIIVSVAVMFTILISFVYEEPIIRYGILVVLITLVFWKKNSMVQMYKTLKK